MADNSMFDSLGITTSLEDPHLGGASNGVDFAIVLLHPNYVWRLMDSNQSDSSRAQATVGFAITLCHEMMHAIYRTKNTVGPNDELHVDEPFYAPPGTDPRETAWISELGYSWEQTIIGGGMVQRPLKREKVGGLFLSSNDLPNGSVAEDYRSCVDWADHDGDTWYGYAVPSFVSHMFASDEFWQTHVAKYGLPALRVPKLFRTELALYDSFKPRICQLEYALPEFHLRLQEYADRMRTRLNQYTVLRPWYFRKADEWLKTPYARRILRDRTTRFRDAYRKGDEWAGQEAYRGLGAREQWGDFFTNNGYLVDQEMTWMDEAVAYLMLVVMPIRRNRITKQIPFFRHNEFSPSAAALADAAARSVRPFEVVIANQNDQWDEAHLETRNIAFNPNDPNNTVGTRATLMSILKDEIPNRQKMFPVPDHVYQAIKATLDSVDREAPKYETPYTWLSDQINFVLPPWQTEQAITNVGYAPSSQYVPYNPSAQPQGYVPGAPLPSQQSPAGGSGPPTPAPSSSGSSVSASHSAPDVLFPVLGTPPGSGRRASARSSRVRVAHSGRRGAIGVDEIYYAVGEVGDHISTGDLWIIAEDGAYGYDVYDATDVVEEIWADDHVAFDLGDYCERTLLGLKARPLLRQRLEGQAEPLGKLILPMRRHEIAERDGRHGRPLWISVGNDVFDISMFPFESDRQRNLMTLMPGGNPWKEIVKDGTIDYDQLFIDLQPYRCAVVASQVPYKGPGTADEFHFTLDEVACHVYPEATMYTVIRGQVYNLNGYVDFHPGGRAILRQWAGRDSTLEFERYHADADRCLADYDYLRVGRVVAKKAMNQLTHNEVALNGHVYDLSRLGNEGPEREFIREIEGRGLRGSDITTVLNDGYMLPPPSLLLLPQRPDLIVAKVAAPLREIDVDTLRANDGSHMPPPEGMKVPRERVEADLQMPLWVSHGDLVYDMTAVSKWGPEDVKAQLNGHDHRYRGAVIPPSAFATRLQQDYGCRVIGRLVRNPGRPRDEGGGDGDDGDDRAHQRPRLY